MTVNFNSTFSHDLEVGQLAEQWLGEVLTGKRIEVKRDKKASQTGNLFIEYMSRGQKSGISTTNAEFWAFVLDEQKVIIAPTQTVKELARVAVRENRVISGGDQLTSKGALVRLTDLISPRG